MAKPVRRPRPKQKPAAPKVDPAESQAERSVGDLVAELRGTAAVASGAHPAVSLRPLGLTDVEAEPTDERELRLLVRDWRRGRATRHVWEAIQDAYVAVFAVLMIGAMIVNAILSAQRSAAACTSVGCLDGRSLLPWATLFGTLALTMAAARLFGPVLASAAEGFWLFDAPIRRSRLLLRRLVAVIAGAGVLAGILGALVATLSGSPWYSVLVWAATTALGASALTAFAAAEQGADRRWTVKLLQGLASALGVAVLVLVVAVAVGWNRLSLGLGAQASVGSIASRLTLTTGDQLALGAGIVAAVILVLGAVLAARRLDRIHRARLLSGGSLVSGMQGAMYALDLGLMRDILVERDARERGRVKPTKGRGLGLQALVWRDMQRLVRFPKPLVLYAVSIVVPYAVGALGLSVLNPLISGLVLMTALVPMLGTIRVLSRTRGLARTFPFTTAQLRSAGMTVPGLLALVWALAIAPAYFGVGGGTALGTVDALTNSLVTGIAGLLAAVRWVTAKQVDFNTPMVSTSMGALPPGLMFNLFRGFDVTVLITAPILLGWSPLWSAALAGIVYILLRGTFSMDQMKEMQEENQRLIAEQKAAREGASSASTRRKIPPPRR